MASGDDVQLPDLQVIQRYSLAVRGASAPRADVIAALQADLAWLSGDRTAATKTVRSDPVTKAPAAKAPAKAAKAAKAPVKAAKAPAKKSARRA